ncbi:MAG: HAD-IA family hydrolase [Sandaracinus sp.]|nr:HAD-IA family hydrolase [Sandaracinus sp.]MCB9633792.1 HAD-IA family hydrolase [Sandaracinus sp.]
MRRSHGGGALVLLLDVMDTLVRDPFYEDVPRFFGMSLAEVLAQKDPSAWPRFERGEIDEGTMLRAFFADGRAFDHDAFCEAVRDGYAFLPGIEALLEELAEARVPMFALSNYPCWSAWIEARLGLGRFLDWRFVSWRTGVRKPDPEAFRGPVNALGVAPEACLFVDDRESNCVAARNEGLEAHRFVDAPTLREALVARGVLR